MYAKDELSDNSLLPQENQACFPLLVREAGVNGLADEPEEALNRNRILFVDDEPGITEMAGHILRQSGFRATFFIDAVEALNHFKEHADDFDAIITDFRMPRLSGAELAALCSAVRPKVPIILATGFSDKISMSNCHEWGITTIIDKPFSIAELLATLEQVLK